MNNAEQKYGLNWNPIVEYVDAVRRGFLFEKLGVPDLRDDSVKRLYDEDSTVLAVDYDLEEGSPENSEYLRFLLIADQANGQNEDIASAHSLEDCVEQAVEDAGEEYTDREDWSDQFERLISRVPEDEAYPFYPCSVQDHCAYIATELAVAHVTPVHLFRDMWYWYRAGHWPCGWEGDWPDGRLVVF